MATSPKVILGLGNPLLDISVNVDQAFYDKYEIKDASACLATDNEKVLMPMFDVIEKIESASFIAGGATQNAVRGASWASPKTSCGFIGSVGDDDNKKKLTESANKDGVNVHYSISKEHGTGRCAVLVKEKERSLVADLSAANDYKIEHFQSEPIQEIVKAADIFYSASFFLTVSTETLLELGPYVAEAQKTFVLNISAEFLVLFFWDQMSKVLPYADYVICNETEAACFAEKSGWDKTDIKEAAKKLSLLEKVNKSTQRTVIFTQGCDDTIVAVNGEVTCFPVAKIEASKIIDTNGAGDAFAGGFLAGLSLGKPVSECVAAGNYTASLVIQQEGSQYVGEPPVWN